MKTYDLMIIGAGASGLAAGIFAARKGLSVCIIERNKELGKKILITGNGRGNLSNRYLGKDNYYGEDIDFPNRALEVFDFEAFFKSLSMPLFFDIDGRVFPHSLQSKTLVYALEKEIRNLNIDVKTDFYIKHIEKKDNIFIAYRFDNEEVYSEKCIIATGGKSYKGTGSDGNGYELAKRFGHNINRLFPGIVAVHLEGDLHKKISGVKIPLKLKLKIDEKEIFDEGDLLFTNYGISGPPILQFSSHINRALYKNKKPIISVELLSNEIMDDNEFFSSFHQFQGSLKEFLSLIINDKIVEPLLDKIGLDPNIQNYSLDYREISKILNILRKWDFYPIGTRNFNHAQITCGGVDTREINKNNMESKLVEGLYFIGEILDVDGDCGGYNLHWAFASGYLATLEV